MGIHLPPSSIPPALLVLVCARAVTVLVLVEWVVVAPRHRGIADLCLLSHCRCMILWIFLSAAVILINKYVLSISGFPYPVALTCTHMLFCSVLAFALVKSGAVEAVAISADTYLRWVLHDRLSPAVTQEVCGQRHVRVCMCTAQSTYRWLTFCLPACLYLHMPQLHPANWPPVLGHPVAGQCSLPIPQRVIHPNAQGRRETHGTGWLCGQPSSCSCTCGHQCLTLSPPHMTGIYAHGSVPRWRSVFYRKVHPKRGAQHGGGGHRNRHCILRCVCLTLTSYF